MSYLVEIDLHNHTVESGKKLITETLKKLPSDVREVNIIHGYHNGTALRDMVRRYNNAKIERKIIGMNQGSTTFVIKRSN